MKTYILLLALLPLAVQADHGYILRVSNETAQAEFRIDALSKEENFKLCRALFRQAKDDPFWTVATCTPET
jgi:hypothetical protein